MQKIAPCYAVLLNDDCQYRHSLLQLWLLPHLSTT